jgi:UDP-4-amino-4,6-dideoxy-N-acetyl-beta-L-altrosamine N-acetyltransferase
MKEEGILITLVPLKEEFLPVMVKWRNNPSVSSTMFDRGNFTIENQVDWYNKIKNDSSRKQFIIIDNKSGNPIGAVNLMNIDKANLHCDWGYYIGEDEFRMSGHSIEAEYMILKYAFNELSLNKVYCQTLSYNKKVLSIHKKFGFSTEGILRQHYKESDNFADVVLMSILKDEFQTSSKQIELLLNFYKR